MDNPPELNQKKSWLAVFCAAGWVVAFLLNFFGQQMPNTSEWRSEIWSSLLTNWLSVLNPLDYTIPNDPTAGWQNLGERLPLMLTAAILLIAAWSVGNIACRRLLNTVALLTSERLVIVLGIGISLQTLWILGCGLAGQLTPTAMLAPGVLGLMAAVLLRVRRQQPAVTMFELPVATGCPASTAWKLLFLCPLLAFGLHIVLGGMTPPFDLDVREYHMQGPKEWFLAGRIQTLEHNVYTSFPFLSEMLSLAAMVLSGDWWSGAIAGKLTLAMFQLLSMLAVYAIGRRWLGQIPAYIGAVAFLSTPWVVRISTIAYAEGAITFYLIASVMTALLASRVSDSRSRAKLIALTGCLAGSAMASKYPGVLSVILPVGLFLLTTVVRHRSVQTSNSPSSLLRDVGINAAIFVVGVTIAVGPWLLKNAVATGNPVYPLAYSVFGAADWSPEMDAKWKNGHSPSEHLLAQIPEHVAAVAVRNDWQNGFLFAFAVPALLLIRRQPIVGWLWLHAAWLLMTWWLFTHRIDRFWVPLIPVVAVLAGAAWHVSTAKVWQSFMVTALAICAVFNYGLCRHLHVIGFHVGLRELAAARELPIRHDLKLMNAITNDGSRVLMVGEAEVFDADFDLVYNTVFDESIFQQWTSRQPGYTTPAAEQVLKSATEIRAILQEHRITHVFVNWSEILRYRLTYGYTEYVVPQRFTELQQMGIIDQPTALSTSQFDKLTPQQQQQIQSWAGHQSLLEAGNTWTNVQLFRVRND